MALIYRRQFPRASQVFDLEDAYARERKVRGRHPRPIGPVRLYVVGRMANGDRQDLHKPLELVVRRNPSGYYLFFGLVRLPNGRTHRSYLADGTYVDSATRRSYLDDGKYVVRVESRYYQPVEQEVDLPMPEPKEPTSIDLSPGYAYPFPKTSTRPDGGGPTLLRGSVHYADGRGIAEVKIEVVGQEEPAYWTDGSGQWVLVFPDTQPPGDVTVRFTLGETSVERDATIVLGHEKSLAPVTLA